LKIRYRGHSCVEVQGNHHILIDPDFTHEPDSGVEYICITHAHRDHIGRITEVPAGMVLASEDVCEIVETKGIPHERLHPVKPGEQIDNIKIFPGFSMVSGAWYALFSLMFRWRLPDPGGTPLSFLIEDEITLLHIGDANEAPLAEKPDLLCLPWRESPVRSESYKNTLVDMANAFAAQYILPIHYDLKNTQADPREINGRINAVVLNGYDWYEFMNKKMVG